MLCLGADSKNQAEHLGELCDTLKSALEAISAQLKSPAAERVIEELEKNLKLAVYLLKTMLQLLLNLK